MKLVVSLLVFAHFSGVICQRLPQTLANICPSLREVSSTVINVDGHGILQQEFACPDSNFTLLATAFSGGVGHKARPGDSDIAMPRTIEGRGSEECTDSDAECECGTGIACDCFAVNGRPSTSDCGTLINSLTILASTDVRSFVVQPTAVRVMSFGSCAISFINLSSRSEEYCWGDLAGTASIGLNCLQIPTRSDSICIAIGQEFAVHLGEKE